MSDTLALPRDTSLPAPALVWCPFPDSASATTAIDQLRSMHDAAGVGLALVGSPLVRERLGGANPHLAQLFSRVGMRLRREKPLTGDVAALLAAWGIEGEAERKLVGWIARKPGALRNGAPFKDWTLPPAIERVRRRLGGHADGDRQMVGILAAMTSVGIEAVEAACAEALGGGPVSRDIVLNILTRQRQPPAPLNITTPEALRLRHEPVADCARYDSLRRSYGTPRDTGDDERTEACRYAPCL